MARSDSKTKAAKLYIEEIRVQKFSIGQKNSNPLTQDLHYAVTSLSAELYTKDVHFLMELIKNADDNEYEKNVETTLVVVLTKQDSTETGAPATLLIFNNEVGFSRKNMDSVCSVGRSTKKGKLQQGFIGEKGIGFKSVFLVSSQPYIFSNGYRVRFREGPDPDFGIGYIVPEWVGGKPGLEEINHVYDSAKALPQTIFILPLKPEKVEAVRQQLSELHPEILLFLSKVKRLYVRENNHDPKEDDNISIVSISSDSNHVMLSSKGADSCTVQLSVEDKALEAEETCKYFIWRQTFPVKPENRVSSRTDVDRWIITLAFPNGKWLKRGTSSVGVFVFLPTAMVTNFLFISQADFILASSQESVLLEFGDSSMCPNSFCGCFSGVCERQDFVSFSGPSVHFLPAQESSYSELNNLRESIRKQLQELGIIPCELFGNGSYSVRPCRVVRIMPKFRDMLSQVKNKGAQLHSLHAVKKVLHSSLDNEKHRAMLDWLGVDSIENSLDWYSQCLKSCNLVAQASAEIYIDILCFVAESNNMFTDNYYSDILLLKYTNQQGKVKICSISQIKNRELTLKYALDPELHSYLSKWHMEFGCSYKMFFLPNNIQESLLQHDKSSIICSWLSNYAGVESCSVGESMEEEKLKTQ